MARSIIDVSPRAARLAWIANGVLFAIGASFSIFARLSDGGGRESIVVRRAGDAWTETWDSNLFPFLFFQLVLFLIPLLVDLNWRRFQLMFLHSEQLQRARDARYQEMDSVVLYASMCSGLVAIEFFVFAMALLAVWGGHALKSVHAG